MAAQLVTFRTAVVADAPAMAEVDRLSWPSALATTVEQFRSRIATFPEGQVVAESGGRIVGSAGAQRVTQAFLSAHSDRYERATDGNAFAASHTPHSEIYQLIGVGVAPEFRGERLGRQLVDRQIAFARLLPGVRRIMGFTRPAGYHHYRHMAIEDYVQLRRDSGELVDPVLAFHLGAGATIVSIHRDFRDDEEACGYGVLIEYPLDARNLT